MLGERRSAILEMIIDYYIRTGEPMGSKTLCQMLPYSISSATIRNEMAFLTSVGFLEQRHTSGGRVPTKAAYRYYIDNIINGGTLSPYEKLICYAVKNLFEFVIDRAVDFANRRFDFASDRHHNKHCF